MRTGLHPLHVSKSRGGLVNLDSDSAWAPSLHFSQTLGDAAAPSLGTTL